MLGMESSICHILGKCSTTELRSQHPSLKVYSHSNPTKLAAPLRRISSSERRKDSFRSHKAPKEGAEEWEEEKKQHLQLVGGWRGAVETQAWTGCDTWRESGSAS